MTPARGARRSPLAGPATAAILAALALLAPAVARAELEVVAQWGEAGSGPGQLHRINSLDARGAGFGGRLYLGPTHNRRIDEFRLLDGGFVRAWGKDVGPPRDPSPTAGSFDWCSTDCSAGKLSQAGEDFALGPVSGVAVSPVTGWVYAASVNRIRRFAPFQDDVVPQGGFGSEGTGAGQFQLLHDLDFDAAVNVYVADDSRVQVFDSAGNFQRMWGKGVVAGGGDGPEVCTFAVQCGPGTLAAPRGVEADAFGNVWVSEDYGRRVQRFSAAGAPLDHIGGSGSDLFHFPGGMAVDADGYAYVADQIFVERITKLRVKDPAIVVPPPIGGAGGGAGGGGTGGGGTGGGGGGGSGTPQPTPPPPKPPLGKPKLTCLRKKGSKAPCRIVVTFTVRRRANVVVEVAALRAGGSLRRARAATAAVKARRLGSVRRRVRPPRARIVLAQRIGGRRIGRGRYRITLKLAGGTKIGSATVRVR